MLDIKRIRTNPEEVKKAMVGRSADFNVSLIDEIISLDEKRREVLVEVEALKGKRNQVSSEIPKLKKAGEDVQPIMA